MVGSVKLCLLSVFILSFSSLLPARADEAKVNFRICYEDVSQPPYYFGAGTEIPSEKPGIYIDISDILQQRLNLNIQHFRAPWKRCLAMLRKNAVGAVYGASFKEDRLVIGRYPMAGGKVDEERRITTKSYSLYRNAEAKIRWDGAVLDHNQGQIGAPLGYSIIPFLEKHGAKVVTRWTTESGLDLVSLGRLQSFAAQDPAADALIIENPHKYRNVVKVVPPLQTKSYYMMISHGFYQQMPKLAEEIWNTIALIRNEELPKLYVKYAH